MEPKADEVFPKLTPMLSVSNKEFKRQFGHLAGSWRGKKPLQRNAIIALTNLGGRESLPQIEKCLDDQRPVIRGTAVWSLGQLTRRNPDQYLEKFKEMLITETDEEVLLELRETIDILNEAKQKA